VDPIHEHASGFGAAPVVFDKCGMLFNSLHFAIFFAVVAGVYFALPYRWRWSFLLAASYYFYMAWIPKYAFLILASTLVDYVASNLMVRTENLKTRRRYLYFSIFANLGMLFFFKYFNFFGDTVRQVFEYFSLPYHVPRSRVLLPVGISFYTFQTLGYTIDVYRGHIKPEKHFGIFALYVAFFPQLVAGPIERAVNLLPQFRKQFDFDYHRVTDGIKLIAWGLFKKVVIADRVAVLVDYVYGDPQAHTGPGLALATLMFAYQIYCDFSGYSDIAIGTAQVLGFDLMVNFRRPYAARSLPDLWRRWHISLTSWFRDYVFIPLGGTRVPVPRIAFNLFIVFLITGLWHGASWTFIIWGSAHGLLLVLSFLTRDVRKRLAAALHLERIPRLHTIWQVAVTFLMFYSVGVFFRAESVGDGVYILRHLLDGWANPCRGMPVMRFIRSLGFRADEDFYVAVIAIIVLEVGHFLQSRGSVRDRLSTWRWYVRWPLYYLFIGIILGYGVFTHSPFIYFQF